MTIDLIEKIDSKLELLKSFFLDSPENIPFANPPSLYIGKSGMVLLHSVYYQIYGGESLRKTYEKSLSEVIEILEDQHSLQSGICTGLSGVGWLIHYLTKKRLFELDADDFLEDLDTLLIENIPFQVKNLFYDLLHSSLGIGFYLIKRKRFKAVEQIVAGLYETAIVTDEEIKWQRFDDYHAKAFIYDLGLAHGNAGILNFLSLCYENEILTEKVHYLLKGLIRFFLNNKRSLTQSPTYFVSSELKSIYPERRADRTSRLAWCYGDLGITYTLLLTAERMDDNILYTETIHMLLTIAKRRYPAYTGIEDAAFCHGTAGVGYIFLKLYQKTKNTEFLSTAEYWAEQTINLGNTEGGSCGYLFALDHKSMQNCNDLLNGLMGVNLFLLSLKHADITSDWSECFFLE